MNHGVRMMLMSLIVLFCVGIGTDVWARDGRTPLDFDGDGTSDLAVYNTNSALWYIMTVNGTVLAWDLPWGYSGSECVAGDFDGNGATDLGVYDPRLGKWYIRTLEGKVLAWGLNWGFANGEAVVADFDGDGADDLGVFDTQLAVWYIRTLSGKILMWDDQWGYNGCEPLAGSNGTNAVPIVYDDQTSKFYLYGNIIPYIVSGRDELEGIAGDVNGDGIDEFGKYDANGGFWYLNSPNGPVNFQTWGFKGGVPLLADYDGDGMKDYAVYDTAAGGWYIKSYNGTVIAWNLPLGGRGYVPVGRPMANRMVDNSTARFGDSSATFNVTSITVTDLERGTVSRPALSSSLNLLPGWYEVAVGWYGSKRSGIFNWYRAGTSRRIMTIEPRRNYQFVLKGGSLNPPYYDAPSLGCTE